MEYVILSWNGEECQQRISLPKSYEELKSECSVIFKRSVFAFYKQNGTLLKSSDDIKNGDILYAAGVEKFKSTDERNASANLNDLKKDVPATLSDWIKLNVGGKRFSTTRTTLMKYPSTMLAKMFDPKEPWENRLDEKGYYLIDRSAEFFEPLLNFMRSGALMLNPGINIKGVLEEARFFNFNEIVEELEAQVKQEEAEKKSMTRSEFSRILMSSVGVNMKCQGINLAGADLSYLDLSSINFKYADLSGANLSFASLDFCNFTLANLSRAIFDHASLDGVCMVRANLASASLRNCKFESKSGRGLTNMQGANLKNAVLDGSQMSGINMRLAMLKDSSMKTCALRHTDMAGADIENCDLTGGDLHGANLRGANVDGAVFLDLVTPLHMVDLSFITHERNPNT